METEINIEKVLKNWYRILEKDNTKTIEQKKLNNYVSRAYFDGKLNCCITYKGYDLLIDFSNKTCINEGDKFPFDYLIIYENIMDYDLVFATKKQVEQFCQLFDISTDDLEDIINANCSDIIRLYKQ